MPDIAAADVTYTNPNYYQTEVNDGQTQGIYTVAFGNGALTYPTGGVPLTKAKFGCPNSITSFVFVDPANANGFVYKYSASAEKLRIYQGDNDAVADGALIELIGGAATPAAASLIVRVQGW